MIKLLFEKTPQFRSQPIIRQGKLHLNCTGHMADIDPRNIFFIAEYHHLNIFADLKFALRQRSAEHFIDLGAVLDYHLRRNAAVKPAADMTVNILLTLPIGILPYSLNRITFSFRDAVMIHHLIPNPDHIVDVVGKMRHIVQSDPAISPFQQLTDYTANDRHMVKIAPRTFIIIRQPVRRYKRYIALFQPAHQLTVESTVDKQIPIHPPGPPETLIVKNRRIRHIGKKRLVTIPDDQLLQRKQQRIFFDPHHTHRRIDSNDPGTLLALTVDKTASGTICNDQSPAEQRLERFIHSTGGDRKTCGQFPYRLLGKPVYLSDNMPTIASGAKAVLYGDYSGLSVKISEELNVQVLLEKYATQHAIGIVGWMEIDSAVADAQKLAVLVMSAA